MAKKKRYRGHFCRVCARVLPNEKFSGRGRKIHVCNKCKKLPLHKQAELTHLNKIDRLYKYLPSNLSRSNRAMLEQYMNHGSPRVRAAARELLDLFTGKKYEEFYDEDDAEIFSGCDAYVEDITEIDDSDDPDTEDGKSDFDADDKELPF